ncbi:MAG: cytoplasmic iron level regulating protein YaaA (DUF328/UPF0246 family) [Gammaproteobacteria bacterium]|jgi:cytoplasmic iron level regulating protein YaaA (DUF328/UPF0246 family)
MLTVISPAKTLDYDSPVLTDQFTNPAHLTQSRKLIKRLRQFSAPELSNLMKVSPAIGDLNADRFKRWKTPFKPNNARQALFAFKGDVYIGLDAYSMSEQNLEFAQDHLRMLSGLYGILRPLDLMQPYRLEMGTRLSTDSAENLYQFWDDRITKTLNQELKSIESTALINLASIEYFKSVKTSKIKADVITPTFKDYNQGEYKIIGFFAKKARGAMSRYIIDNELTNPMDLQAFDVDGYRFDSSLSKGNEWVFTRKQ